MAEQNDNMEAQLAAYVDGELSPTEIATIEAYLARHPAHAQLVQQLKLTRDWTRALPRETAPAEINEMFQGQLERSMLLQGASDISPRALRINRWPQYGAVAAILLLALGLGGVVYLALPPSHPIALESAVMKSKTDETQSTWPPDMAADKTAASTATPHAPVMGKTGIVGAKPSSVDTDPDMLKSLSHPVNNSALEVTTTHRVVLMVNTSTPAETNQIVQRYLGEKSIAWRPVHEEIPPTMQLAMNTTPPANQNAPIASGAESPHVVAGGAGAPDGSPSAPALNAKIGVESQLNPDPGFHGNAKKGIDKLEQTAADEQPAMPGVARAAQDDRAATPAPTTTAPALAQATEAALTTQSIVREMREELADASEAQKRVVREYFTRVAEDNREGAGNEAATIPFHESSDQQSYLARGLTEAQTTALFGELQRAAGKDAALVYADAPLLAPAAATTLPTAAGDIPSAKPNAQFANQADAKSNNEETNNGGEMKNGAANNEITNNGANAQAQSQQAPFRDELSQNEFNGRGGGWKERQEDSQQKQQTAQQPQQNLQEHFAKGPDEVSPPRWDVVIVVQNAAPAATTQPATQPAATQSSILAQ